MLGLENPIRFGCYSTPTQFGARKPVKQANLSFGNNSACPQQYVVSLKKGSGADAEIVSAFEEKLKQWQQENNLQGQVQVLDGFNNVLLIQCPPALKERIGQFNEVRVIEENSEYHLI